MAPRRQPILYLIGVAVMAGVIAVELHLKHLDAESNVTQRRKAADRDWLSRLTIRIAIGLVGFYFCLGFAAIVSHRLFIIAWLWLIAYSARAIFETVRDIRLAHRRWSIRGLMMLTALIGFYCTALQLSGAFPERVFFITIYMLSVFLLLRRTAFRYSG